MGSSRRWSPGSWLIAAVALLGCSHDWDSLEAAVEQGGGGGVGESGASGTAPAAGGVSSSGGAGGGVSFGGAAGAAPMGGAAGVAPEDSGAGGADSGQGGQSAAGGSTGAEIDPTEVTRAQYDAWLAMAPEASSQDAWCAWNGMFAPDTACMGDARVCVGAECGGHPQVCVDWCDAAAYCRARGKRLCGRIGGGSTPVGAHADASISQWMKACSAGGKQKYPYGSAYSAEDCNGPDNGQTGCTKGACKSQKAAGLSGCQPAAPGYVGVFDLSGNAAEWEDSCSAEGGAGDSCGVRGGAFDSADGKKDLRCSASVPRRRDTADPAIGFRCCGL